MSRNLIPYLTAQGNVELPMLMAGSSPALRPRVGPKSCSMLSQLSDRRQHRLVAALRRAAAARRHCRRPGQQSAAASGRRADRRSGLGHGARVIWETFRQLSVRFGLTTVIVTHDPKIAHEVDRVVSIRDGKTSTETVRQVGPAARRVHATQLRRSAGQAHLQRVCRA